MLFISKLYVRRFHIYARLINHKSSPNVTHFIEYFALIFSEEEEFVSSSVFPREFFFVKIHSSLTV